ncbi:hypothetical protein PM082_022865 [Marasmius tenuissimus]|nr:hypothetical protein PM082_022865 [Marasmius tenuissimus]
MAMMGQYQGHGSPSSTRFADICGTNYAPSKEEIIEIRSLIHDPEEEIRRIDEEISRLQARRDELQQFVGRHQRLLSPFRRLPGELWGEVFVRCLPDKHLPVRKLSEAPLIFTVICRSWRNIALKTPRLWSSLHLALPSPSITIEGEDLVSLLECRREGLRLWLERSGTLPLNLSLVMNIPLDQIGSKAESYSNCIGIIADYCRRWRTLSLFNIIPSAVSRFQSISPEDLPLLVAFSDVGPQAHRMLPRSQTSSAFFETVGNSLSLRKLRTTINPDTGLTLPVRWGHLHLLEIQTHIGLSECAPFVQRVVESSPLLLDCILLFSIGFSQQSQLSELVAHHQEWSRLHKLAITFDGYVDETFQSIVVDVFETITTPVLTHLSLSYSVFGTRPDRDRPLPFDGLITRSGCALKSLELQMSYGTNLQTTLDHLTLLTTLSLSRSSLITYSNANEPSSIHLDPEVVPTLMASEELVRCPNIEHLILRHFHPRRASTLIDLIESRARFTKLKSFVVDFGDIQSKKTTELVTSAQALVESKELGIEIEWKFRDPFVNGMEGPYAHFPGADYDSFAL